MRLPTHIPPRPIAIPLIYEGLSWCELCAWHDYARRHNQPEICLQIQAVISDLPANDRIAVSQITYYKPIDLQFANRE
jgi:hypothetical protein